MAGTVEKYRRPVRILHWTHAGAFVVLFLTGLVLFVPALGFLAAGGWTRLIHRAAAAVFIIAPVIYLVRDPGSAGRGLRQAFIWGKDDLEWLKAAPLYYFQGRREGMPPQGSLNAGQKIWWLLVIIFGAVFVVTGSVMWFGVTAAPAAVMAWMVFFHDVAFVLTGVAFFQHVYLSALHPLVKESWRAMTSGRISAEYAKAHHGRWYAETARAPHDKET
jgi:formate dehydrogenase subunit gamma